MVRSCYKDVTKIANLWDKEGSLQLPCKIGRGSEQLGNIGTGLFGLAGYLAAWAGWLAGWLADWQSSWLAWLLGLLTKDLET